MSWIFGIGLLILAIVFVVLWETGFARDVTGGARMIDRGGNPLDVTVTAEEGQQLDPVCGMAVAEGPGVSVEYDGGTVHFCSANCRRRFEGAPESFLGAQRVAAGTSGGGRDVKTRRA